MTTATATDLTTTLQTLAPPQLDALLLVIQQLKAKGTPSGSKNDLDLSAATPVKGFRVTLAASPRATTPLIGSELTVPEAWMNAKGPKGGLYLYAPNTTLRLPDGTMETVELRVGAKYAPQLLEQGKAVDAYLFRAHTPKAENVGSMTQLAWL